MPDKNKSFEDATQKELYGGCIKFSTDYVSRNMLYEAASEWAKSDDRVKVLAIRGGGGNSIALDFRYDVEGLGEDYQKGKILEKTFKPVFTKLLGGDYMNGYDFSIPTTVIK